MRVRTDDGEPDFRATFRFQEEFLADLCGPINARPFKVIAQSGPVAHVRLHIPKGGGGSLVCGDGVGALPHDVEGLVRGQRYVY